MLARSGNPESSDLHGALFFLLRGTPEDFLFRQPSNLYLRRSYRTHTCDSGFLQRLSIRTDLYSPLGEVV